MKILSTTFFCSLLFIASFAQVQYSRVAISIPFASINSLQKAGIEADHGSYDYKTNQFITTLSSGDLIQLKQHHFKYTILIEDETQYFLLRNKASDFYESEQQNLLEKTPYNDINCEPAENTFSTPLNFTPGTMGGYYTLDEIYIKVNQMIAGNPLLVRKDTIGYSFEKRPIIAVKISDNVNKDENEPEILYTAIHHAREPMSMMQLVFFMQYLLEHYNTDADIKKIINNRELFFVLCVNPDGYEFNRSTNPNGGGYHRKNRDTIANKGSNIGVDLNRNYGVDWGFDDIGSSPVVTSDTYRGKSGFSEPETQVIRKYVNSRKFTINMDYHSYSNVFVYPYGVPQNHNPIPPDEKAFFDYSKQVVPRHNFFVTGTAPETVGYSVNGVSGDWYTAGDLNRRNKVYAFTGEIGTSADGFWPLANRIIPLCKQQMYHNLQIAYMSGSYFEIQDKSDIAVTALTGTFSAIFRQIGVKAANSQISLIPLQNIQAVGLKKTLGITGFGVDTSISISYTLSPSIQAGQKISFAWKVITGGITYTDTVTKFYQPQILLTDNMEGNFSTNWSSTGAWNFNTESAFTGLKCLHDNITNKYADNTTNIVNCKTILDLSNASNAFVSFWMRYRSENGYDKLTVEVSTNGLTGPFNPVCGSNSVTENFGALGGKPAYTGIRDNWVREIVDLSAFTGKANIAFRFKMTSDNGVTEKGFYIDDIMVIKSVATVLPVRFINFKADKISGSVQLNWQAVLDADHDYFEVEKAMDGIHFTPIYKTKDITGTYNCIDNVPFNGNNFYRVKQVGKDGNAQYSIVIPVIMEALNKIAVYPNPAKEILNIRLKEMAPANSYFRIINNHGQQVNTGKIPDNQILLNIPLRNMVSGLYGLLIQYGDGTKETISFIKE